MKLSEIKVGDRVTTKPGLCIPEDADSGWVRDIEVATVEVGWDSGSITDESASDLELE